MCAEDMKIAIPLRQSVKATRLKIQSIQLVDIWDIYSTHALKTSHHLIVILYKELQIAANE